MTLKRRATKSTWTSQRQWRAMGATVFLITHALDEAAMLSDGIAVMCARPGRILEIVETG